MSEVRSAQTEFKSAAGSAGVGGFFVGTSLIFTAISLAMKLPQEVQAPMIALATITLTSGAAMLGLAQGHYKAGVEKSAPCGP